MSEKHSEVAEHFSMQKKWYVIRFLYNDQPKIRARLTEDHIETFSPMRQVVIEHGGKHITIQEQIIRDLFFCAIFTPDQFIFLIPINRRP